MNNIFRKRNMSYNTSYYPSSQNYSSWIWKDCFRPKDMRTCSAEDIRDKVFKNGPTNFWRTAFKNLKGFALLKGCLPQILLGPFLNTLSHKIQNIPASLKPTLNSGNQRIAHAVCVNYTYHNFGFFDKPFVYCIFVWFNWLFHAFSLYTFTLSVWNIYFNSHIY